MPITLTVKDRIAEIVFDTPPVNAFDSATWMSLPGIIKEAAANPEANVHGLAELVCCRQLKRRVSRQFKRIGVVDE